MKLQFYQHKVATLASKHKKEVAIGPLLYNSLGIHLEVFDLDTDQFGTFSGEIERKSDALDAARSKALEAFQLCGKPIIITSEGSFGPHPSIPFIPYNQELILFSDFENGVECLGKAESTDTNFSAAEITHFEDLENFARAALFPSHALILKCLNPSTGTFTYKKGISDHVELKRAFEEISNFGNQIFVETDMRAMYNPKRMSVIAQATQNLIDNLRQACPACEACGFTKTHALPGLPCSLCGTPTHLISHYIYTCKACGFEDKRSVEASSADAMYCNFCNP